MVRPHYSNLIVAPLHGIKVAAGHCAQALYPNYEYDVYYRMHKTEATCFHNAKWDEIVVFAEGGYYNEHPGNLQYDWVNYRETESAEEYKEDFCGGYCTDVLILTNEDATHDSNTGTYDFSNTTELGRVIFGAVDESKIQPKVGEETNPENEQIGGDTTYKIGFYFRDEEGLYHDLENYFSDASF